MGVRKGATIWLPHRVWPFVSLLRVTIAIEHHLFIDPGRETHDRTQSPHNIVRRSRSLRRDRIDAACACARHGRSAVAGDASAGLVSLQGRQLRDHLRHRRPQHVQAARHLRRQREQGSGGGQYHGNLKAAGIDRNAIDVVIISHFHGDHINGLITPDKKPSFPNAEIMVPAAEWKYFMDDGEMSRQTTDRMKGVFAGARNVFDALGRKVTQYEPGKELAPGITSVATNGHTPGHNSHIVASGNSKVYVQADVTNHPALFVRNPGWHAFFDQDAKMAEETRRKLYDMLVAEKMLVQGFHYPFPGMAYIEKAGNGYREIPVMWNPTL
jgi:glyoxylase-like metal-dependent hydrolase (beta-lactamase superfamily II)